MNKVKIPKSLKKLLQTKRLNLKPIPKPSFKAAQDLYDNISATREHFKYLPALAMVKGPEDEYNWLQIANEDFIKSGGFVYGVYLRKTGEFIGTVGLHAVNWTRGYGELGAWLYKDFAYQGYVPEAIKALEDYVFGLGFHKLVWKADSTNRASCRGAVKCGYVKEGVEREAVFNKYMNRWENHARFSKLHSEWNKKGKK